MPKRGRETLTKTFLPRCLLFQFPHLSIHSHSPSAPSCFLQIKTPQLPVCAGAGSQQAPDAQERHRQRVPRGAHDFFKQEARGLLTPGEGPGKGGHTILQHWLQGGSRCSGSWEQFGKTIGQPHSSEPLSDRNDLFPQPPWRTAFDWEQKLAWWRREVSPRGGRRETPVSAQEPTRGEGHQHQKWAREHMGTDQIPRC